THTATTAIYTLSLHDALPISAGRRPRQDRARGDHARGVLRGPVRDRDHGARREPQDQDSLRGLPGPRVDRGALRREAAPARLPRSEEHTSELQSLAYLVCRLL